jgi:hypothetical protein
LEPYLSEHPTQSATGAVSHATVPGSELPYVEVTDPEFATQAALTFIYVPTSDGGFLKGPCPRCGEDMEFPLFNHVFKGGFFRRPSARSGKPDDSESMMCTCKGANHAGRPNGEFGCGAYWKLTVKSTTP